tara:strand:- start:1333 stop:2226 length:894 start_codon:yes stop_codon:yes gene_type:complete
MSTISNASLLDEEALENNNSLKFFFGNKKNGLENIEKEFVLQSLGEYGLLHFKGFDTSLESFSCFIEKICSRVTNDPARKASSKNAQKIVAGEVSMGLHLENGNAPFIPDLQFFYCKKAPQISSRTTYCDGARIIYKLPHDIRQQLEDRQIMYTRRIEKAMWKKYFSTELGRTISSVHEILPFLPDHVKIIPKDNGDIEWRVQKYVVYTDKLSKKKVHAHSILAPSVNYEIPVVTWSDGSQIDPRIISTITRICEKETHPLDLEDGDVVVVNNHRVMHGRENILDPSRQIYGGQGYL